MSYQMTLFDIPAQEHVVICFVPQRSPFGIPVKHSVPDTPMLTACQAPFITCRAFVVVALLS
jgi:hypothetical protein